MLHDATDRTEKFKGLISSKTDDSLTQPEQALAFWWGNGIGRNAGVHHHKRLQ